MYPLLKRLESEGLIHAKEKERGSRESKILSLTPAGKKSLIHWLKDIERDGLVSQVFDPVRTRIFFIDAISNKDRQDFFQRTLKLLEGNVVAAKEYLKQRPVEADLSSHLGALGGLINAESRVRMVKAVLKSMEEQQ